MKQDTRSPDSLAAHEEFEKFFWSGGVKLTGTLPPGLYVVTDDGPVAVKNIWDGLIQLSRKL